VKRRNGDLPHLVDLGKLAGLQHTKVRVPHRLSNMTRTARARQVAKIILDGGEFQRELEK
jgi:hypothetical protein